MTEILIFSIVEKSVGVAKIWYPLVQGWHLPPHGYGSSSNIISSKYSILLINKSITVQVIPRQCGIPKTKPIKIHQTNKPGDLLFPFGTNSVPRTRPKLVSCFLTSYDKYVRKIVAFASSIGKCAIASFGLDALLSDITQPSNSLKRWDRAGRNSDGA